MSAVPATTTPASAVPATATATATATAVAYDKCMQKFDDSAMCDYLKE